MGRLLDRDSEAIGAKRLETAREAAARSGAIVLLKGDDTIVTDGERLAVNAVSSPQLATAGTGDVLSGMIAAMIARGMEPFAGHLRRRGRALTRRAGRGRPGRSRLGDRRRRHRVDSRGAGALSAPETTGRAVATIDAGAVERNCRTLKERVGDGVELCAVVKANGYGHGAAVCAAAALRGGATRLAVAAAAEAEELRLYFPDVPILVMGALTAASSTALTARRGCRGLARGFREPAPGWRRLAGWRACTSSTTADGPARRARAGAADRARARLRRRPALDVAGVWTHFATADEEDDAFLGEQLPRFAPVAEAVRELAPDSHVHAANSAATLRDPATHFDMVRCGIAVYGLDPFRARPGRARPGAGARAALLRRRRQALRAGPAPVTAGPGGPPSDTWVGVLPIGYGDGVGAGSRTTRRCSSAAAAIRWSARSRWTTSPSTSVPRPTSRRARRRS